jgi:hypothetical protein
MKLYTFYWLDGRREVLTGKSPIDAYRRAGYGNGARSSLDFTMNGDDNSYYWDDQDKKWYRKFPIQHLDINLKKVR